MSTDTRVRFGILGLLLILLVIIDPVTPGVFGVVMVVSGFFLCMAAVVSKKAP